MKRSDYYHRRKKSAQLNYEIAYGLGACYTYKQEYSIGDRMAAEGVASAPDPRRAGLRSGMRCFKLANSMQPSRINASLQLEPDEAGVFPARTCLLEARRQDEAKAAAQEAGRAKPI